MEHLRKHKLSLGSVVCGIVLILGGFLWMWIDVAFFEPIGVNFGPGWMILGGGLLIIGGLLGWIISILAQKVFRRR